MFPERTVCRLEGGRSSGHRWVAAPYTWAPVSDKAGGHHTADCSPVEVPEEEDTAAGTQLVGCCSHYNNPQLGLGVS
jgi:hypothetical protein